MIGMEKTRMNYDHVSKLQRDSALNEEWQKLNGNTQDKNSNDSSKHSEKSPLQQQQEKLAQMQASIKANKTQKINTVSSVDSVNSIDTTQTIDTDILNSKTLNYQNAGHFDMKQDIASFVRPNSINADNLKRDTLGKTSVAILTKLELSGASDALINRAKSLFQEESTVKSVTDAYRNALIFS